MIKRKVETQLETWKDSPYRKPLILRGARQVGKTTLVREFSRNYDIFINLNLDLLDDLEIFSAELEVNTLYQLICLRKSVKMDPAHSLLFIDEIQNSSLAIKMLRYFYENLPQLSVIAAGSLLEVVVSDTQLSFPVGRVENLWIHPLSFAEYLGALRRADLLECYESVPINPACLQELKRHFKTYAMLGGMPEVVVRYLENPDLLQVNRVYESLFRSYLEDVGKYAVDTNLANAIRHVLSTAFAEAGKRITLEGFGNSGYRSQVMKEAFDLLQRAQLLQLFYPVTSSQMPMLPNFRRKPRLQMLDTGLLNYQLGIQEEYFLGDSINKVFKGNIIQHLVGQELQAQYNDAEPRFSFWIREKHQSSAEVDFVLPHRGRLIPIEVKSGSAGTLRSLMQFMQTSGHDLAVRIYEGDYSLETVALPSGGTFRLLNLPLCQTGKIKDYLDLAQGVPEGHIPVITLS